MTNTAVVSGTDSNLTPEQIELVKRTVARGASDDELQLFIHWCKTSGFDPLRKQAHFQIRKSKCQECRGQGCSICDDGYIRVPTFIAGIDGLLSRANDFPEFGGVVGHAVHANDEFEFDAIAGKPIKHIFKANERGQLMGAWVTVYFKNGKMPLSIWHSQNEYKTVAGQVAGQMPELMIVKAAMAIAMRRAFPNKFSGVYGAEEFGGQITEGGELLMPPEHKGDNKTNGNRENNSVILKPPIEEFTIGVLKYRQNGNIKEVNCNGKWVEAEKQVGKLTQVSMEKILGLFENPHEMQAHLKKHFKGVIDASTLTWEELTALFAWRKDGKADRRWYEDKIQETQSPCLDSPADLLQRLTQCGLILSNNQGLVSRWIIDYNLQTPVSNDPRLVPILEKFCEAVEKGIYDVSKTEDKEAMTADFEKERKRLSTPNA